MTKLSEILARKRLVVFLGEGGVGKTSCAAALALAAACDGRRSAVLTIDPAPRLGHALGIQGMDDRPRSIELPVLATSGGSLHALRLDTKRTFDRVVERLAPSQEVARAVLTNPIYRALAGSIGGSDAYMALQRLYELEQDGYELLVLDTPPAVHANEVLSAPSRLAALVDTDAAKILANPALALARAGSALAKATAAVVLPVLERVTGMAVRRQLADFVGNFEGVLIGLSDRARSVDAWLRSAECAFVVVTRPTELGVGAALALVRSLAERNIRVEAVIVNRSSPPPLPEREAPARFAGAPSGTREAAEAMERAMDAARAAEHGALERLRGELEARGDGVEVVELRSLEHDVGGVADLLVLARALAHENAQQMS
jgi:anion-transporting  ArsA/GET3 family ATPase